MKKISFNVVSKNKGFITSSEYKDFLLGKTIEIISKAGGHNYGPIGTRLVLDNQSMQVSGGYGTTYTNMVYGKLGLNSISFTCFTVIENLTKEDLENQITDLLKEKKEIDLTINDLKLKIEFLKESGSKEYNENEFKAYKTLELLENKKLTKIEKAKLIASLLE